MRTLLDGSQGVALSASAFYRRLITIYGIMTIFAGIIAVLLLSFGLDVTTRQLQFDLAMLLIVIPLVVVVDALVLRAHVHPIGAFLEMRAAQRTSLNTARLALIRALNLPLLTTIRIMTVHGPLALLSSTLLIVGVGNPLFNIDFQPWQIAFGWSAMFVVVPAHAILEYFAVIRVVRPVIRLIWDYAAPLEPELRQRIIPVGLRRRLLFLSIFITFVPLVVLGFTVVVKMNRLLASLNGADAPALLVPLVMWVCVLITCSTIITVAMAILTAREIDDLAGTMVRAMQRVERGELDTQLKVTSTDEFAALYEGFNRMTRGLQERERLQDAFGRYVSPQLAEDIMRHGVSLGGEMVHATVLFADIREFTALAERMPAAQVVGLLNDYFAAVEPIVQASGGWINKFGGDSLLAVFGAPLPQDDHAHQAIQAALGMRRAVVQLNERLQEVGSPILRIGVGVHTGMMVAGTVGSPSRLEYTVIGDIVNVAARIDGLNKEWGTDILISREAYVAAGSDCPAHLRPPALVKGKSEPIQVYELL